MTVSAGEAAVSPSRERFDPTTLPALIRLPMSAMMALSALAGYLLSPTAPGGSEPLQLTVGIFLLAAGCSALNQVQERAADALMERTRHRPIPAGKLAPKAALCISAALLAAALLFLAAMGMGSLCWGIFALLWYNGVYTLLKRYTLFALLAGSLCGAIPPLTGWGAAGGAPTDFRIVGFAAVFLLWQIPHYWMLCARYPGDCTDGILPSIFQRLDGQQLRRVNAAWLLCLAAATLHLAAFDILQAQASQILCLILAGWLVAAAASSRYSAARLNRHLSLYMSAIIGLFISDFYLFSNF